MSYTGRNCNSLAPISILPDEMLQKIFWHLGHSEMRWNAAQTCRNWRNISLANPLLWRDIQGDTRGSFNKRRIEMMLLRAKDMPLDLRLETENGRMGMTHDEGERDETVDDNFPEDAQFVAEIIHRTSGRLRSLHIKSHGARPVTHFELVLPPCRSLTVLKLDWSLANRLLPLFLDQNDGAFAQVNHAEFRHVVNTAEHFTLGYFPNLTTLVFDASGWVDAGKMRHATVLTDILATCKKLEQMVIDSIYFDDLFSVGNSVLALNTPHPLRRLVLSGICAHSAMESLQRNMANLDCIQHLGMYDCRVSEPTNTAHLQVFRYMMPGSFSPLGRHIWAWSPPEHFTRIKVYTETSPGYSRTLSLCSPQGLVPRVSAFATLTVTLGIMRGADFPYRLPNLVDLRIYAPFDVKSGDGDERAVSCPALRHVSLYVHGTDDSSLDYETV